MLASGSKDIIDWSFSEFGGGWYPEYLSRLIFSGSGFAWLQGSNNLFWYDGTKFEAGETGFSTVADWGGGKEITTRDKTVYRFNPSGLLVEQGDRNGNTTHFSYQDADLDGNVDEIHQVLWPNGTTTTFTYNSQGLVTGIDEPGPEDLTLSYDTAKRLSTIQLPAPSTGAARPSMSVSYDGSTNRISTFTDFNGFTWSYTYDSLGGVQTVTQPDGGVAHYQSQRSVAWTGTVLAASTSNPGVRAWGLNLVGATDIVAHWTTAEGKTYQYRTDEFGYLTYLKTPLGFPTFWERDLNGQVIVETSADPDGSGPESAYSTWNFYDEQGRIVRQVVPGGDAGGRLLQRSWTYGTAGQVTKFTEVDGSTVTNQLDSHGNALKSTWTSKSDGSREWQYTYTTAPATGGVNKVAAGQVLSSIDPTGLTTQYTYDSDALGVAVTEAPGTVLERTTAYRYNVSGQMTQSTDASGHDTAWLYDALGRLSQIIPPLNDNETVPVSYLYTYGPAFFVAGITDLLGRTQNFAFNYRGQETSSSLSASGASALASSKSYDLDGRLVAETNSLGGTTDYEYDDDSRVTSIKLPLDSLNRRGEWTFQWDALNRQTLATDPTGVGSKTKFEQFGKKVTTSSSYQGGWADTVTLYDDLGYPTQSTDPLFHVTKYAYSSFGDLTRLEIAETAAAGAASSVWTYQYNGNGQLLSTRDPMHQNSVVTDSTRMQYDALGRLTRVDYPVVAQVLNGESISSSEVYTYDALDRVTQYASLGSPTTTYQYDNRGRLTTETLPDPDATGPVTSRTTSYSYNAIGQPLTVTTSPGAVAKYVYNGLGQLVEYHPPAATGLTFASEYASYSYNAAGQVVTASEPLGGTTTNSYDALGQLISSTTPASTVAIQYGYDLAGRPVQTIDALGITTSTAYVDGRVSQTTDGKGAVTSYSYNANGRLASLTDPLSNTTSWVYNRLGLPTQETKASGTRTYAYDLAGNKTSATDRTGKTIAYTYDALGQVTREQWQGGAESKVFYYTYAPGGHLKQAIESDGSPGANGYPDQASFTNQVSFSYDSWGRVTSDVQQWKDITSKLAYVTYEYSGPHWGIASSNVNYADSSSLQSKTAYTYDDRGEVATIVQRTPNPFSSTVNSTSFNEKTVAYTHDVLGRVSSMTRSFKAGLQSPVTGPASSFSYDTAGRIAEIHHSRSSGGIAKYNYTYDADSRITQINSLIDGLMSYTYDNAHQLTGVTYGTPLPNPFDVRFVGRQGDNTVNGETFAYDDNGNNTALSIDDDNEMTSDGRYTYVYDAEGRPTSRTSASGSVTTYTWDNRGRLVKAEEQPSGSTTIRTVTYEYDPLDRRIRKWVVQRTTNETISSVDHRYVYDGQHIALELVGVSNTSSVSSDVKRRMMYGPGIDEVLAEETAAGVSWALADHLGTIHDWVDASTGSSQHYVYSAFGKVISISGPTSPASDSHLFGFTGRETDADTGLTDGWMYYRARYYDPSTDRFTSQDPIGFAAGDANLYRYVGNEVTGYNDPSGLQEGSPPKRTPIYSPDVYIFDWLWRQAVSGSESIGERAGSAGGTVAEWERTQAIRDEVHAKRENAYVESIASPSGKGNATRPAASLAPNVDRTVENCKDVVTVVDGAVAVGEGVTTLTQVGTAVGVGALAMARSKAQKLIRNAGWMLGKRQLIGGSGRAFEGHGYWPRSRPTTIVPEGTRIWLPSPGTTMDEIYGHRIARDAWDELAGIAELDEKAAALLSGGRWYNAGEIIPDYMLDSPNAGDWLSVFKESFSVDRPTALSGLLSPNMGDLAWAACTKLH